MDEQTKHKWLPSEPTDDILKNLIGAGYSAEDAALVYDHVFKAAPVVEQEPVLFAYISEGHVRSISDVEHSDRFVPLYTHPQPKQSEQSLDMVKREPLSYEYIVEIANSTYINNALIRRNVSNEMMFGIVRAIEKAHGIGE